MGLKKILAATVLSLFVVVLHVGPVLAGATSGDLPAPGILGLVAAAIVGTIFLARRGK
jgi:membrane protease YdiL (CAAX protease family)